MDVRALINKTQIKTKETLLNVIVFRYLSPDPNQFSEVKKEKYNVKRLRDNSN